MALTSMTPVIFIDLKAISWLLLLITQTYFLIHMSATPDATRHATQIYNFYSPVKGATNVIIGPNR
jgi:hypothetical protein